MTIFISILDVIDTWTREHYNGFTNKISQSSPVKDVKSSKAWRSNFYFKKLPLDCSLTVLFLKKEERRILLVSFFVFIV